MIKQALENLKITALNAMQEAAIAAAKKGDVILLSPTGSGKTLGFLLPLLGTLKADVATVQRDGSNLESTRHRLTPC